MTNGELEFKSLIVGLAGFLHKNKTYPFPILLQQGCNFLALILRERYPRTMFGLLAMFEAPVNTWYSLGLPAEFDCTASLMYDGQLSEEASRYLFQELLEPNQLPSSVNDVLQQIALENHGFKKLIERLQTAAYEEPIVAQQEYVQLRSFLISYPYVSTDQLRNYFSGTRYILPQQVGDLYDDCLHDLVYWNCTQCGPLVEKSGQLRGIKPSVCNDHRPGLPHVQQIKGLKGLRRIKPGLHWRVCLPGISEMRVFRRVEKLQKQNSDYLYGFALWPGIDRYDLQLQFSDHSVWAVDIKDHQNPYGLANHLNPIYGEASLSYNEGFYVVPMHRIQEQDNYLQIARNHAVNLPSNISLISEDEFERRIIAKITTLQEDKVK